MPAFGSSGRRRMSGVRPTSAAIGAALPAGTARDVSTGIEAPRKKNNDRRIDSSLGRPPQRTGTITVNGGVIRVNRQECDPAEVHVNFWATADSVGR